MLLEKAKHVHTYQFNDKSLEMCFRHFIPYFFIGCTWFWHVPHTALLTTVCVVKWYYIIFLKWYGFIVHNELFDKTSHFDHVYSIFIILNILHVSLTLLSTLSLWGNCPYKKTSDVFSDITTTILSFLNGGWDIG